MEIKDDIWTPDNTIILGYRGSIAHNMYIPNTDPNSVDDIDLMGVYLANVDHYIGIEQGKQTIEKFTTYDDVLYDMVHYELVKFVKLMLNANPNVLGLLWLRPEYYPRLSEYGEILVSNKRLFSSKKAYKSFTGYAFSQLLKMEKYNHEGYMGEKRKALVEKYGYDCKNASHCIRLLKMGTEFLSSGELNVFRDDAETLLEIKRGEWTLDQVKAEADRLFKLADEAYAKSKLPDEPDYAEVNRIVRGILFEYVASWRCR